MELLVNWLDDRYYREMECLALPICRMTLALLHDPTFILAEVRKSLSSYIVTTRLDVPMGKSVTFEIKADGNLSNNIDEKILVEMIF